MAQQRKTARASMELRARYLVLLLLAEGPKTGYELIKRIRSLLSETSAGISPGTLYPLLRSLEEEGLVESREEPRGQRMRKVYTLTSSGVERLLEMIQRGLEIIDTSFRLHIEAARRLLEEARIERNQALEKRLAEIAARLDRLEETIRVLRGIVAQAARGREEQAGRREA